MTNIVLLFMVAQVQVSQQVQVSRSDLPLIVEAVLQDVVKEDVRPGRPVYLDVQQTATAFRENLIPQASLRISDVGIDLPGRALLAGARDEVLTYVSGLDCSITGNGISVSIHSARAAPTPGEVLLIVGVYWLPDTIPELCRSWGYGGEFFLARTGRGRGWEVVRRGRMTVS